MGSWSWNGELVLEWGVGPRMGSWSSNGKLVLDWREGDQDIVPFYLETVAAQAGRIMSQAVACADVVDPLMSRTRDDVAFKLAGGQVPILVLAANLGREKDSVGILENGNVSGDKLEFLETNVVEIGNLGYLYVLHDETVQLQTS